MRSDPVKSTGRVVKELLVLGVRARIERVLLGRNIVAEIGPHAFHRIVAAEEAAVRALHKSHDDAVNGREEDGNIRGGPEGNKVMEFWLDSGSVLVAHTFFGNLVAGRTRQKVHAV